MNYEIKYSDDCGIVYWPNTFTTNNVTYTYSNVVLHPRISIEKNKNKFILKLNSLDIHLTEKELVDLIIKAETAL